MKHITLDNLFISFLIILITLPILAPILMHFELHFIAKPIYFMYSFFCHQFHTRSIHIFDNQIAWCARDMGIWMGFLTSTLIYKFGFIKELKFKWLILFIIPIALDGGIQTLSSLGNINTLGQIAENGYHSNNLLRFLTGSFFGMGLALFISPKILKTPHPYLLPNGEGETTKKNSKFIFVFTYLILFSVYLMFIQLWSLTSTKYEPSNILDSKPKLQEDYYFERRKNGECPVGREQNILFPDCFF